MKHKEESSKAIGKTIFYSMDINKAYQIMMILEATLEENERLNLPQASFESCLYIVMKERWVKVFGDMKEPIDPFETYEEKRKDPF